MPTLILEGPDSSGKTTLAYALLGWMGPRLGHYVKSPAGRTKEWDESWDEWNAIQLALSRTYNQINILDRTPEISELVYGRVVRGFVRLRNPMSSLIRLNHPDTLIIMTATDKPYGASHKDPVEDPVGNAIYHKRDQIAGGYELVDTLIKYYGHDVGVWDYKKSQPRWITHKILSKFKEAGLMMTPMVNKEFRMFVDKGKEIVNGSI